MSITAVIAVTSIALITTAPETDRKMRDMKTLLRLFLTFAKIGAFTFGGGYAMLSLLDRECVEKNGWLTSDEMMDITAIAESTPGPIAINCATYTGYKTAGVAGSVVATFAMILPSFIIILAVSYFFENLLQYPLVANAFKGIRAAVCVLIIRAAVKMIRKMSKKPEGRAVRITLIAVFAVAVLVLNVFGLHISTIYLILIAGALGFALSFVKKGGRAK